MDTIWIENSSKLEVIGRCGGDEKPNDHAEPTKVDAKTFFLKIDKIYKKNCIWLYNMFITYLDMYGS